MTKLRHKEIKKLFQGHTARVWQALPCTTSWESVDDALRGLKHHLEKTQCTIFSPALREAPCTTDLFLAGVPSLGIPAPCSLAGFLGYILHWVALWLTLLNSDVARVSPNVDYKFGW